VGTEFIESLLTKELSSSISKNVQRAGNLSLGLSERYMSHHLIFSERNDVFAVATEKLEWRWRWRGNFMERQIL